MGKIQVLSDLLANKIAAGEVVERRRQLSKSCLKTPLTPEARRSWSRSSKAASI